MTYIVYIILALCLFGLSTIIYRTFNKGLSHSAKGQQATRFGIASILAVLPYIIAGKICLSGAIIMIGVISASWMMSYPVLYYISHRKISADIDNYMDIAFGLYIFGWLSCLYILLVSSPLYLYGILLSLIEIAFISIIIFQAVYYILYRNSVDEDGIRVVRNTNINEIIEFTRAYSIWPTLAVIFTILSTIALVFVINAISEQPESSISWWKALLQTALFIIIGWTMWKPRKGAVHRTGIVKIYDDTILYSKANMKYIESRTKRMKDLSVSQLGDTPKEPHCYLMIIGESATRDYMSAFTNMDNNTTPWLKHVSEHDPNHFILFPNAYSCGIQTVPTLERALTEKNQYNDMAFNESCSIIDIAEKLGYTVKWYSNQGHLGTFDTPITIVAETATEALWTKQEINKVHYDHSLIDFLDRVDPSENNLVVLHLKGSHFNYLNRYPSDMTIWGKPGIPDSILNYENALHYTDSVLRQAFEYCKTRLNLQAMLYFSDHGDNPTRHRTPQFCDFIECRIPMFVYMSDEYIRNHNQRYESLISNRNKYFTNDLIYDLMCGIFDIKSNKFNENQSLAYNNYRFSREDLRTFQGKIRISDDK